MIETVRHYNSFDNIILEYQMKNDKIHGHKKCWYLECPAQLFFMEHYNNGKIHGVSTIWHRDGSIKEVYYYIYAKPYSKEEYEKHKLIESIAGLGSEDEM